MYALVGIPLMFIYMANIGTILATSFKYTYSKMCRWDELSQANEPLFCSRCEEDVEELPKKATLPSIVPPAREEYPYSTGETAIRLCFVSLHTYSSSWCQELTINNLPCMDLNGTCTPFRDSYLVKKRIPKFEQGLTPRLPPFRAMSKMDFYGISSLLLQTYI